MGFSKKEMKKKKIYRMALISIALYEGLKGAINATPQPKKALGCFFYGLFLKSKNIFFSVATALCDIKALGVKIVTLA